MMVSNMNKPRSIYLFWASMDAFYIVLYILRSAARGAIPFWSDLNSGLEVVRSWGGPGFVIWVGLFLQLSVIVTCVSFFKYQKFAVFLAVVQMPLRLFFIVPSISVVLLLPMVVAGINNWMWVGLLIASEAIKGWSIWRLWRTSGSPILER
ncbi:hypothetical protein IRZ81_01250 [Pseudomonas putida]|nr:hypothetical protein [Pseudomonas putida]MBF8678151.1 hypothetical protein [Pseudomonas fulva]MBH3345697.1 hypothetical protein [Pseudomonas parafulva]MBF8653620.1 hypothetical protein [Pseudomonas putida]MBF8693311.1 hypothetical protein [Pseudomonas fulva]